MKKITILLALLLVLAISGACKQDPSDEIKEQTIRYWDFVFAGKLEQAYEMLSFDSKKSLRFEDFAAQMAFVPLDADGVKECYKAFSEKARMSIVSIDVGKKGASANVEVLLLTPAVSKHQNYILLENPKISVEDLQARTIEDLSKGRIKTLELRVIMQWIKEDNKWKFLYGI